MINVIDLFAGCGGFSEGFMQAGGYQFLAHLEWEKAMVNVLRNRLEQKWQYSKDEAKEKVIQFDIQASDDLFSGIKNSAYEKYRKDNHELFNTKGLDGLIKDQVVDLIIGGPPCQAYSVVGRAQSSNGMKDDYRNYLFEAFAKVVAQYQPKLFVFENVMGLLSAKPGSKTDPTIEVNVTDLIFEHFNQIGYEVPTPKALKDCVFNVNDYGVPQNRKRIIIIGISKQYKEQYLKQTGASLELAKIYQSLKQQVSSQKKMTVADAIKSLPIIKPLDQPQKGLSHALLEEDDDQFHRPRYHNASDVNLFKKWIGENYNAKSNQEKKDFYLIGKGKQSNHIKYRNLEWDKPSPTIVAHLYKDGLMFLHPDIEQARSITVREAALLQSFDADFEFDEINSHSFKMIGNAVPPKFAKEIAQVLRSFIY
jgi:DNA (cytosine-5)-methyltransferase 1